MKLGSDFNKMKNFKRISEMEPKILSSDPDYHRREFASKILPEGATLADRPKKTANWWMGSTGFGGYGGSSMYHTQRPYMPEFDSPDRQWYPEDRCEANRYWRLFYKTDPMFGTAVEMYSTMMTSEYDIVLENTQDASVKKQLEDMCETVNLQKTLQDLVKEYLVLGEAIPHCFFSQQKGIWTHVGFHDPDYVEIIDSSMIDMEPMIYFVPPDELRELLTLSTPEAMELRRTLPVEFVSKVLARQKIRLSPLNCSFIPRKLHPYDERGVSLASRLWRINMVEDAVYNSTISTYRRSAAPLKVLKLGDPNTGWIPAPETEQKLLSMVTQAENDVQSWIVTNYGANFETWGNQDRAITLKMEYDTIEKVKLVALGMSKSFMSGEISFACQFKDAKILMNNGLYKDISEVKTGEFVIDKNGDSKEVTDVLSYDSPDEMIEITLFGKKKLTFTDNHVLPVLECSGEEIKDLQADCINVGNYLMIPRKTGTSLPIKDIKKFENEAYTLGMSAAFCEGYLFEDISLFPLSLKISVLCGLFSGGGGYFFDSPYPVVSYSTNSFTCVMQVELILAQLGYFSEIVTDSSGRYTLSIKGSQVVSFITNVWPACGEDGVGSTSIDESHEGEKNYFCDDEYMYVRVIDIQKVPVDKSVNPKVYSLTVEGSHSYTTSNIASHNSAKSGLQVFLRRLLSMRQFFEAAWIYPKFFNPIIEINDWNQRSTTAEVNHRIKVKRTAQEAADKGLLVTAKLKWKNRLDSAVDEDLLRAIGQLKQYGFDVSMATIGSTVGMDWKDEQKKKAIEFIEKDDLLIETLGVTKKLKYEQQQQSGAKPPGAAGSGAVPPSGAAGAGGKSPAKKEPSTPPGNSEEMTPSNEAIEPPGSDAVGK